MEKKPFILKIVIFICLSVYSNLLFANSVIKVGVFEDAPLVFMDSNKKAKGYFVDIIEYIAKKENWKIEYVPSSFSDGLKNLQNKKIDIFPTVSFTEARGELYNFNKENVVTTWGQVYISKASKNIGLFDIQNKRVAVSKADIHGASFEKLIKKFNIDCKIIKTDSYHSVMKLVRDKKVDAGVVSHFFGMQLSNKYKLRGTEIVFNPINNYFAFSKDISPQMIKTFDKYIKNLKEDKQSIIYKSLDKWFKTESMEKNLFTNTIVILSAVVVLVFLIYMLFQISTVRRFFGLTRSVEKNVPLNILLFVVLYVVIIWSLLAFSEYIFLNDTNKPLLIFFELTNNPNRILARFIMICSILLGGVIVSRIFARLAREQQLTKEYAEKLRITLNSIGDGVIVTDTSGNVVNMNPIAQTLTGWKMEEALGKPLEEVFCIIDSKTKKIMVNPVKKVLKYNKIVTLSNHTILISKDKTQYQIGDSAAPILDINKKTIGVVLVFHDVTKEYALIEKLQKSEYQLNKAQQIACIGNWEWNIKEDKLIWSDEMFRLVDFDPLNFEANSEAFLNRIHPDDSKLFKDSIKNVLKNKKPYEIEYRVVLPNGEVRFLQDRDEVVVDDNGDLVKLFGVSQDITDRKRAEEELREKEDLMISQSRHAAMGEMISMIAHQWRQPLSVISMGANNIIIDIELDSISNEALKEGATQILNQTQNLSKTIDDFRNFFKPNKEIEELLPKNIFEETFKVMGKSLENNNIEVITHFNNDKTIYTYSRELMQVLINILKNAKEVMVERRKEEKKIFITTETGLNGISIEICDSGGGIDEDLKKKIFNPYFSTKDEKNGTGLGLYMSKTIVEKHLNGNLKAYNKESGLCFKINLPFKISNKI